MTPSNPDNSQPLIYRILDSLGVAHLVAPVNHFHSKAEVLGLESTLSQLGYKITKSANQGEKGAFVICVEKNGNVQIYLGIQDFADPEFDRSVNFTWQNIPNLQRALLDPDSEPTANSDKLVTSGGVKTALDAKQNTLTFDSTPTTNSTNPVTSGGIKTALESKAAKTNTDVTFFSKRENADKITLKYLFDDEHDQSTLILENHSQDSYKVIDFFETDPDAEILYPSGELQSLAEDGFAVVRVIRISIAGDIKYFVVPEAYYG